MNRTNVKQENIIPDKYGCGDRGDLRAQIRGKIRHIARDEDYDDDKNRYNYGNDHERVRRKAGEVKIELIHKLGLDDGGEKGWG